MKKYYNLFILLVVALTGLSLTSCSDDDDLNTDQYGNDISLQSFGPCPVLRGGTLHFLGTNLDQITEIHLPGADPITQIEVIKAGRESEITIQVPAEKCDTGIVILKTAKGGEIKSVTPVTYREDITLSKFYVGTDGNLTGSVGQTVTIKGDYLNLIHGVVFADNDTVKEESFTTHDRYTIEVAIPKAAKTGKLVLTDMATPATEIQTDEALTVNLPTATALSPAKPKAGQTLTISGTSLDQIESVRFNGAIVPEADLKKAADGKTLTLTVPETAADGEVTLVTYSGVEIPAGNIETVVPTELKAEPAPVKNGATLTISGKDLDLVKDITFPNSDPSMLKTSGATKITAEVPATAQEGDITLNLTNGKTVTVAYTLVKPKVTSFTPASLIAGNQVLLRGTDLDLVASVTFPGEGEPTVAAESFTAQTESAIGLTVPASAAGSGVILNLVNGDKVEAAGLTVNPSTDPSITADAEGIIGADATVNGKNFNNVETVYIGTTKVVKFSNRTNTAMTFQIPATVPAGTYDLIMVDYSGKQYTVGKITAKPAEQTIWSGSFNNAGWSGNQDLAWGGYDWTKATAGQTLTFYFTCNDPAAGWACISLRYGDGWGNMPDNQIDVTPAAGEMSKTYTLTEEGLTLLRTKGGLVITGDGLTFSKVTLK
jgi:fructose-specific phosphotransferase system component IIB